jgi:hypothetical protein
MFVSLLRNQLIRPDYKIQLWRTGDYQYCIEVVENGKVVDTSDLPNYDFDDAVEMFDRAVSEEMGYGFVSN